MGRFQVIRAARGAAVMGLLALAGCSDLGEGGPQGPAEGTTPTFAASVRPILQGNCVSCHGGALASGGLDLSRHAGLLAGGLSGAAVVAGDADGSLLVARLESEDPFARMPFGGQLGQAQIDTIRQWIDGGALDD